jgi:phenylalanyl-tRNA synthetase alpha chain
VRAALAELREAARAEIAGAADEAALEAIRLKYLGRKGSLNAVLRELGQLPADERPAMGALANEVKDAVTDALAARQDALASARLEQSIAEERIDVTMPGRARVRGHVHPLRAVEDELVDIFVAMGFQVVEGPELEDDFHNFGALNIPSDHPARDMHDTFYVAGADDVLLRTHTSPVQIRALRGAQGALPVKTITPGRVYRRDVADASHSPVFHQVEGLAVDTSITMADLKGTLALFAREMFGPRSEIRFRPSFFPFTEPSAEVDVRCFLCAGAGCRACKQSGWLEILGSGMVHPQVLRNGGYDPEDVTGWAFGMGIERIAMLKYGVDDLRLFFDNDLRFLRQFA